MRTHLRIVAGSLKGRRLTVTVAPHLRPTPDLVREALFSILGAAVPGRPFVDLFAGTGAVGMEALSRGARPLTLVEWDVQVAAAIIRHLQSFGVADQAIVQRADVYRWIARWDAPSEPVTIFLGPPFPDFERRTEALLQGLARLQQKLAPGSVLVLQSERSWNPDGLPDAEHWEHRQYGRNRLSLWTKEI
ncbi:MAG TPA: RsmD family RNA methyltransferase [Gemmataceae bacterium]|nr:RsmD family RNA methyltransferase [Gemmataceae bacterium]